MYDSNFTDKFAVNFMILLQLPIWAAESSAKNIDIDTLLNDVLATCADDEYSLLYVGATWCAPCKGLRPVLINILDGYSDIPCYEINLNESISYQQSQLLRSLPALILYRANKPIKQINGLVGSDKIHQLLKFNKGSNTNDSESNNGENSCEGSTGITAEVLVIEQLKQKIQSGNINEALCF